MAISDEEATQVIASIEKALSQESLEPGRDAIADFLQQWRAEIEAGRPIDRKLKVAESPGLDELAGVPRARTSSTGEFVGKKDYRPTEQLDLLLEALGLSFVAPPMMAARFLETVERYRVDEAKDSPTTISLAPTGEVGEPALQLDRATIDQAAEAVISLSRVLDELSRETGIRDRLTEVEEIA
ncbi:MULTISPECIES: hypothetical protein [unclassified Sphingomonas]|uniref:hypothetical protein n=1 Tax=unclassified Sphingomonas TaxID=196159 RepID=UPI0006F3592B|nr:MULTISPECIES: hypothetical protein [unclassified Sphingomonas]KQM27900.1 hypothetical protein ASE58_06060 [Sphingomonas sp. Leaf9]KQM44240.1 hypothetical protein ASE57_06055 [Sphingomonas sp. Leaf11]